MRSKSEVIIANSLAEANIPYSYEQLLTDMNGLFEFQILPSMMQIVVETIIGNI